MLSVTCVAPVNIAVIKYWGKRDEKLILPINSSLSVTLNHEQLRAKTTAAISSHFKEDQIWLNGELQSMKNARLQNVLTEVKRRARKRKSNDSRNFKKVLARKIHIHSENNFPTAAGLASSAAGYACLVYSLAKLYGVEGEITKIARQGSGSACRSIYGGFVVWDKGVMDDGSDSIATQIAPETHWPELRVLILVVSDQKKHTSSTAGMQTSVETSELLKHRITSIDSKVQQIKEAIINKNFSDFAEITMRESNQLHAVCLDTYPPICYLNDVSKQIIRLIHCYNEYKGCTKVAYTFDAGPNACLFMLNDDVPEVYSLIDYYFRSPEVPEDKFVKGIEISSQDSKSKDLNSYTFSLDRNPGAIQYVIHTKPGPGPSQVDNSKESAVTKIQTHKS